MVDVNKLRGIWVSQGLTQSDVAKKIGLSDRVMTSRMSKKWFGSDEIEKMIAFLNITEPVTIFFANKIT
jgi:transcriptional regulator with XRE-family HTH domain